MRVLAEYEDLELEDIVDGTDDKQIDVISMDERASGLEADIFVPGKESSFVPD